MNLVFDFGAVLFHWRPARLVAESFPDLATTPAAVRQLAQAIFAHDDWHAFDCGALTLHAVAARTAQRLALPQARLLELIAGIGEGLRPIQGTLGLLAQLRQRRQQSGDPALYYLSNMPAIYARTLERKHGFLAWFDGGVFSGDVLCGKPDPAIYRMLQTRYALDPAQTWFIDDVQRNVDAACGLGWRGEQFVSPLRLRSSLANLLGQQALNQGKP
ncbi:MAG: HAD family hydrolase [Rhodoferax sp.]